MEPGDHEDSIYPHRLAFEELVLEIVKHMFDRLETAKEKRVN